MSEIAFHRKERSRSQNDWQLAAYGWIIQSRFEMDLAAKLDIAVRKFQTLSGPSIRTLSFDFKFSRLGAKFNFGNIIEPHFSRSTSG
jgi:hypothetical protein